MLRLRPAFVRKVRLGLVAIAGMVSGTMLGIGCSSRDIQKNVVAGSLAYVKNSATSFWDAFVPTGEVFEGLFNPTPPQ